MSNTIVVNLFAGPGAGKSTLSAYIFSELKFAGINCELAPEFAKDLVWEGRLNTLSNQIYVFGKQLHRIKRLMDQVDVIICDSPIILSAYYKPKELSETFDKLIFEEFDKFRNLNYFVTRIKPYNPKGRIQTEDEAKQVDYELTKFLDRNRILYNVINGNKEGGNIIVQDVLNLLKERGTNGINMTT